MRAQSQEHVERCERATTPASACRCRCNGACHGRRLVDSGAGREAFEQLPDGDPHRLETEAERRRSRADASRTNRRARRRENLERERLAFIEGVRRRNPELASVFEAGWSTSQTA